MVGDGIDGNEGSEVDEQRWDVEWGVVWGMMRVQCREWWLSELCSHH